MENWYLINKAKEYEAIKNADGFSPLQKIILANRSIVTDYELDTYYSNDISDLHSPFDLLDMDKAIDCLLESVRLEKNILIVGDYDQDGVAATVILHKGISLFYKNISYSIPDRIEDGYGINKSIVDQAINDGVGLIITCDNGISALKPIEYARANGIDVIVTDHHEPIKLDEVDNLPQANAIVNPHRQDDKSKFKKICGAMVAYKLICALEEKYGKQLGITKEDLKYLSQFACLGTVSDMMPIINENRVIVRAGIDQLNLRNNQGIISLLNALNWDKDVTIYTIGFLIGPSINSSGRIYTARLGVELFLEEDPNLVDDYAKTLVELNNERKDMTKKALDNALSHFEDEIDDINDIIVLYDSSIHESICGLVAGRLKDRLLRPTIVLTDAQEPGVLKGSGRSIKAYNMYDNMNGLRDYFLSFGGHAMACGLSLEKAKLEDFIKVINNQSNLEEKDFRKDIDIDYILKFKQINFNIINEIEKLGPFGFEYKEPIFASTKCRLDRIQVLGQNRNVVKMIFSQEGDKLQAISFDPDSFIKRFKNDYDVIGLDDLRNLEGHYFDIAYKLDINTFNGVSNIQLGLISMRKNDR